MARGKREENAGEYEIGEGFESMRRSGFQAAQSSAQGEKRAERRTTHIAELRKRVAETDAKLKRLHDAIENGIGDLATPC